MNFGVFVELDGGGSGWVQDPGGVSDIPRFVGEVSDHQFALEWQGCLLYAHGQL